MLKLSLQKKVQQTKTETHNSFRIYLDTFKWKVAR